MARFKCSNPNCDGGVIGRYKFRTQKESTTIVWCPDCKGTGTVEGVDFTPCSVCTQRYLTKLLQEVRSGMVCQSCIGVIGGHFNAYLGVLLYIQHWR